MLAGERYKTSDPELLADRRRTREPCLKLAALSPHASEAERGALRTQPFGAATAASVTLPFICDYGRNIELGRNVYFNWPGCSGLHGISPDACKEGRTGLEYDKAITVGNDVWLGGGAIVCTGVFIGEGAVIGAGSVVLRNIPPGVFAAGNPCRVIRELAP